MADNQTIELEVLPGVMTEETDRGAKGRYIDCDKVRFRQLLPEKLGGWVLASLGNETNTPQSQIDHEDSQFSGLSTTYIASATTIPLATAVTCLDTDPVWLFGTSITGVYGTVTISDVAALEGAFKFDLDIAQTAAIGDSIVIRYPDEFTGGVAVTSGGTAGSQILVLGTNITTYLKAGTIVRIDLLGGGTQFTETTTDISSGTATITLEDPLTDDVAAGTPVSLYARESDIVDDTNNFSYCIRVLAAAMSASVTVWLTEALPVDSDGADINMFPFDEVACDGDQTTVTSLLVTPGAANANADGLAFANSIVVLPAFQTAQVCFEGFSRALHDWSDLEGENWAAIGTDLKLYIVNAGTLFDITPLRESGSLGSPFDTTIDDQTVVVNDVNHGGQVGNFVRFAGATTVGGLDLNDEFQIATVIDADSYTIEADFPATASVVGGGGTVSYEYDIDIGPSGNVTVQGWGTGPYGAGLYGFGSTVTGIAKDLRIWSLDNFGEDLLASPNGGSLYHWDLTLGTSSRAVLVPTAPATIQRMLISPEARHVIAFGAGTGSAAAPGDPDKLLTRWASSEDFTDWIPSSVNTAGDLRLDVGSQIITAVESRGDIITMTDESLHALQFISGDFVFAFRHLGQSVSIIGPNAAADVNGIVYFMGQDDFLMYDGVLRVMPCDVRNQVFDDLNTAQGAKSYCSVNKLFTEVWWFYPDSTSEVNTRYAKYNYRDQVWDFGTMERTAFHDSSAFLSQKPYGTFSGKLFTHETGVDEADIDGTLLPMFSFLATYEMEIQSGWVMHVSEMVPDFKELVGSVDVFLFGKKYPQATPTTEKGPFTVLPTTEKFEPRYRSRQVGYRVESDALGDDWRMGTWQVEAKRHGRRGG